MAAFLIILAIAFLLIGWVLFLVEAFGAGALWGIGCLVFPVVGLVFLFVHWKESRAPFALQLVGVGLLILAHVLAPQPGTLHR